MIAPTDSSALVAAGAGAPFAARDFRDTVGLYPTGVAVVTTACAQGSLYGQTVSSFTSLSLDPPLISFALALSARSLPAWRAAQAFAVNILEEGQEELSARFARSLTDKWSGVAWRRGPKSGAPLLDSALAAIECCRHAVYEAGDHMLFIGHVTAMTRRGTDLRPLVFCASRYRRLEA